MGGGGGGGGGKEEEWTKKTMKDKGLEEGGSKRPPGHNPGPGEVLHQRRKLPYSPLTMAVAGCLITASLAYFTLYSMKKPQASAKDVAKVTVGTADPNGARPMVEMAGDEAARGRQGQSYYAGIMQNRRNMVAIGAVLVAATAGYYYYYRNKKPESTASP